MEYASLIKTKEYYAFACLAYRASRCYAEMLRKKEKTISVYIYINKEISVMDIITKITLNNNQFIVKKV